jgi:predicted AAA+ superfamily ATPase
MFKRALFDSISAQLQHKNALFITGMRQVGKTTLMKQ